VEIDSSLTRSVQIAVKPLRSLSSQQKDDQCIAETATVSIKPQKEITNSFKYLAKIYKFLIFFFLFSPSIASRINKYNLALPSCMQDRHIEDFIIRYIKEGDVVSIGSGELGEKFVKKLALALEHTHIPINNVELVPTSMQIASLGSGVGLPIADINEREVDVGIEFVDAVDHNYNFIKRHSASLIRDKMIAQSSAILVVVCEENNMMEKLRGAIPFEIATFGYKRTVNQLDAFGKARRREKNGMPFRTETGNYIVDVEFDNIFSYEDLEIDSKQIPGVIESGLFLGFADKIVLHGKQITLLSRTEGK